MGASLSYARRYALFALVGIAGEDDLDAPDTLPAPAPISSSAEYLQPKASKQAPKPMVHRPSLLDKEASRELRDVLVREVGALHGNEALASWAQQRLPAKNTLVEDDARIVEATYRSIMAIALDSEVMRSDHPGIAGAAEQTLAESASDGSSSGSVVPLVKPIRRRSKLHLAHVRAQACVVCRRQPCDAHHVKFAEPRAMGRKVSDEFTVPMCRDHHNELHRHGNEMAWWTDLGISPLELAKDFWRTSPIHVAADSRSSGGGGAEHHMAQP